MLKNRELQDTPQLYELMTHPEVYPYVRHKADSLDAFYFLTKQTMEDEQNGKVISRTILDEYHHPIGTINLFDIDHNYGFLATWIGKPYFGKGYNQAAKQAFFDELFISHPIEAIFIKIRNTNIRSQKAIVKLPYVSYANALYPDVYTRINASSPIDPIYDLYVITKEQYLIHKQFNSQMDSGENVV